VKTCPSCLATYADSVAFCPRDGAALRSSEGLETGTILRKKYEVLGEIARGGMGVVYRVRHLLWNEEKAIKLLLDVDSGEGRQSGGFLSEALVMRQLQHPNIVRVEDADFTEDDKLFVVMEYVEGENLQQRMNRGVLPWEQALDFAAQACAGLAAAHQRGIIHRDVKPQNLLLTTGADGGEVVKLIDFGIAKVREDAGLGSTGMTISKTGLFVGTPEYASPEQALGMRGNELDGRTDLYSLGLVLFEMLTGEKPFKADSMVASLMLRLQREPVEPRQLRPELKIPQIVSGVVMKAIAKDREARYRSADEMRQAIEDAFAQLRPEGKPRHRDGELKAEGGGAARHKKSSSSVIAGLIAAVGLAALAVWFFWPRPNPAPQPVKSAVTPPPQANDRIPAPVSPPVAAPAMSVKVDRVDYVDPARIEKGLFIDLSIQSPPAPLRDLLIKVEGQPAEWAPGLVSKRVIANPPSLVKRLQGLKGASAIERLKIEILDRTKPDAPLSAITAAVVIPALPKAAPSAENVKPAVNTGKVKVNSKDGLKYVWIAPGKFMMGCSPGDPNCDSDESPAHEVTISKGFWIGATEVTQAAYENVVGHNPSNFKGADLPVETVNWHLADSYCKAVGMSLPTEAEWEYAARGGSSRGRYGKLDDVAWWGVISEKKTHQVAQKQPNAYGLYDLLGNVAEWTASWYGPYEAGAATDPPGPTEGQYRTARGGSWQGGMKNSRVSSRLPRLPGARGPYIGLRCAGDIP
jgi:serine/threonine protein kinase/formylglycine-generating enzyme required for sulfatase activity